MQMAASPAPTASIGASSAASPSSSSSSSSSSSPYVLGDGEETFNFLNTHKQVLTGILAHPPTRPTPTPSSSSSSSSPPVIILAHGLACHKNWRLLPQLSNDLIRSIPGVSVLRFDFTGCGDSEGQFEYGGYKQYVADLRAAVTCLRTGDGRVHGTGTSGTTTHDNNDDEKKKKTPSSPSYNVVALIGHSMGGNLVLLYTAQYDDIPLCINMSARYHMLVGIRVGVSDASRASLAAHGYCDEMMEGRLRRITATTLDERKNTVMTGVANARRTRIMTLHGNGDRVIPVTDSSQGLATLLAGTTHELHIIDGCDHNYTSSDHYHAAWLHIQRFLTTHIDTAIKAIPTSSSSTSTSTPSSL